MGISTIFCEGRRTSSEEQEAKKRTREVAVSVDRGSESRASTVNQLRFNILQAKSRRSTGGEKDESDETSPKNQTNAEEEDGDQGRKPSVAWDETA